MIHFITQPSQIAAAMAALSEPQDGAYAIDTETTGLDPLQARVRLVQISNGTDVVVLDAWAFDNTIPQPIRDLLEGPAPKILQNAGFDWRFLKTCFDLTLGGTIWDTALAERVLTAGSTPAGKSRYASLKRLASKYLNRELDKSFQTSNWADPNLTLEQVEYASLDVLVLHPIAQLQRAKLEQESREVDLLQAYQCEASVIAPVNALNLGGICVDVAAAHQLRADIEDEAQKALLDFCEELDGALPDGHKLPRLADGALNLNAKASGRGAAKVAAGFNPNSSTQMIAAFKALGYPVPQKDGKDTLDQNLLAELRVDYPLIARYLEMKAKATSLSGITSKILEKLHPVTGRLHAEYDPYGADSGRFTCVAGDTLLVTSRGNFTFEEYLPQEGDLVLTHKGRWMPVIRKLYRGIEQTFKVTTEQGHTLTCTADHKLLSGGVWVSVKSLAVGDTLEFFPELDKQSREHPNGAGVIQSPRQTSHKGYSKKARNSIPQCGLCLKDTSTRGGVQSRESVALLSDQNWQGQPHVRQEWFPAPQVQGVSIGRSGIPDGTGRQRQEGFSTSQSHGGSLGTEGITTSPTRPPHRWEQGKQQPGQSSVSYEKRSCSLTPHETRVVAITPMGAMGVWDIEVMGDHSYALPGFLSHNCSRPNVQQIPREARFRRLFVPDPGHIFVIADYSQIELRIAAQLAGETRILEAYRQDKDLHRLTAALVNDCDESSVTKQQRQEAKALNFGLLYGCGAAKLREQAIAGYGVTMTLEQATTMREKFFEAYPKLRAWHKRCSADRNPYVYTLLGHRRLLVGPNDTMTRRANTPVQGSGADLLKLALGMLWDELRQCPDEARIAALVHDEIVLSVRQDVEEKWSATLKHCMETAGAMLLHDVPVVAEVGSGKDWSAK